MRALSGLLFLFLFSFSSFSQEENQTTNTPTIGVGISSIGFYGDLNDKDYGSPVGGNPGINIYLIQPATSYLDVRFDFLIGQVRQEERSLGRNVNFETDIRAGGLYLDYNFDHFLPEQRVITPFITAGIEAVEFNPKTDLLANGGEPYNYWSDGSIRNISESSPNADQAIIIRRDYSYETDIREAGFNNSTDYTERAFSVPVGLGFTMHLNDQFDFRLHSTMHLTFTDLIDGITPSTSRDYVGSRRGNGRNDMFLATGFSVSYNFQKVEPAEPYEIYDKNEKIDFLASGNTEDFDEDGVIDLVDKCPNTPKGIAVDSTGCPVDSDGDGVPDYLDQEVNSEYPEFANAEGVEMTDEMIYKSYLQYIDSTLEFAEVIERDFSGSSNRKVSYRVKIEEYSQGSTPPDMSKLLSLSDLAKIDQGKTTIYSVGNYATLLEAQDRAAAMKEKGFPDATVIKRGRSGKFEPIISSGNNSAKVSETPLNASNSSQEDDLNNSDTASNLNEGETDKLNEEVVFRVQLGAFKNEPTQEAFRSIPSLFVVEAGGYYRYMSGSFNNFDDAAKHKVKMVVKGYKGAFVVAYKNGKRVSLKSVGVDPISSDPIIGK